LKGEAGNILDPIYHTKVIRSAGGKNAGIITGTGASLPFKVEYPSEAREVAYFWTTERLASEKQWQDGSPASSQAWEFFYGGVLTNYPKL